MLGPIQITFTVGRWTLLEAVLFSQHEESVPTITFGFTTEREEDDAETPQDRGPKARR